MRTLAEIKGFGPVRLKALAARGIETALDLVETLPTGYKDTTHPLSPAQMTEGRQACFTGFVKGKPALHRVRGMQWVSATIADVFGAVRCMWFNQPWMKDKLFDTCEVTLYGRCVRKKSGLFVINPSLEEPGSIVPVYAAVPGVGQKPLRDAVKLLLDEYDASDPLPPTLTARCGLMNRLDALREAHFPTDFERLGQAKERLAFEELLLFQAGVAGAAGERKRAKPLEIQDEWIEEFFARLPFAPTNAQRRVVHEVAADMRKDRAMARMVQGDVGCGKTLIAFCALYLCVRAGGQARCPGVQQGDGHHRQARRRHHSRGRRAQTVKRRLHIAVVAEGLQKGRDDQNHDDGRRHQAQGGNNGPGNTAGDKAHIGGHVHADGARGGLADRQHIRQLGPGEPAGAVRHIVQKRQSGQAAAYGEQAGFEKFVKQLQIDHDRFAPRFLISSPATAAANT